MSLTTVESVMVYLQTKTIAFISVTEITSGTGNFVFRIVTPDRTSFILKHAEPYVKMNPSMPFPVSRMQFEANALSVIPSAIPPPDALSIRPASLRTFDAQNHVLQLSDNGSRTLKDAYVDPSLDMSSVGARLGKWLAQLHSSTTTTAIGDNVPAKTIYRHCYNHVASSLEKFGFEPDLGRRINDKYGSLLGADDECVCHGDFWTGNILLSDQRGSEGLLELTVVDWEMTRRGCGATDVGQFAAEAWLVDHFRPKNRNLRAAFLAAYMKEANSSRDFQRRVAVHFGCHLAFWPTRVPWGDDHQTREIVQVGEEMMRRADEEDWGWLKNSALFGSDPPSLGGMAGGD